LVSAAGTSEELRELRVECAKFASEVAALRETLAVERGRTAGAAAASQLISPTMDSVVGEGRDLIRGRTSDPGGWASSTGVISDRSPNAVTSSAAPASR
jgi:hypothetical protein